MSNIANSPTRAPKIGEGERIAVLATLGPSSFMSETIAAMDRAGVSLFRINLSHTPVEALEELVSLVRSSSAKPICFDSEGAQIRTGRFAAGAIAIAAGQRLRIPHGAPSGASGEVPLYPPGVSRCFRPGDRLDIDFHGARIVIDAIDDDGCDATVETSGQIGSNKGVSLDRVLTLPAMTDKDREALAVGRRLGIRHYALSFASCREDVEEFRALTDGGSVICKIESRRGLGNLTAIATAADAVLIDRGDLSREVPIELIPFAQRRIISTARSRGVPVYVATNLLETMVTSRQPSRAEVNDVVSTLDMGAEGLVLAAETAIGQHPVDCVHLARRLIRQFERWTPNTTLDELLSDVLPLRETAS